MTNTTNTTRTPLPTVTLCTVDTRSPAVAVQALQRSQQGLQFARTVLFTDGAFDAPEGIEVVQIGPIRSGADYSMFVLQRLVEHLHTPHFLLVQWDGFVAHPSAWNPDWLHCDLLGAPWGKGPPGPPGQPDFRVGNGGFTLRSTRLHRALVQDPALAAQLHHPEDICIAQTLRPVLEQRHGMHFGSLAQAQAFAFENEAPAGPTFGFHGLFNLHRALGAEGFAEWLPQLPDSVLAGRDGFKLARNLLRDGAAGLTQRGGAA